MADNQERPVIASIKIDGRCQINDVQMDSNVMTSAYGRNNYDKFMKENIAQGNLLYDIDEGITKNGRYRNFVQNLETKWREAYRNTTTEQAVNNLGNEIKTSEKMGGYVPDINVTTNEISKYNISNYNGLKEVKQKIYDYYKDDYISTEQISKPITNIDTGLKIEIWKNGIMETFGNASYYKNLSITDKKIKLATMDSLAKMIKEVEGLVLKLMVKKDIEIIWEN